MRVEREPSPVLTTTNLVPPLDISTVRYVVFGSSMILVEAFVGTSLLRIAG